MLRNVFLYRSLSKGLKPEHFTEEISDWKIGDPVLIYYCKIPFTGGIRNKYAGKSLIMFIEDSFPPGPRNIVVRRGIRVTKVNEKNPFIKYPFPPDDHDQVVGYLPPLLLEIWRSNHAH